MGHHGATLDDPQGIRRVLQRICREGAPILLRAGEKMAKATLREEREDRILCDLQGRDLEALEVGKGDSVMLVFSDRGRNYQGVASVLDLQLEDPPTCALAQPRTLTCQNPEAFLDLVPERPPRGTYVTVAHDLLDGKVMGFTEAGFELDWLRGRREDFRLGLPFSASVDLGPDCRPVLQVVPAYFTDSTVGLRVLAGQDELHLERYRSWVRDHLHESRERERLAFQRDGFTCSREALTARRPVVRSLEILSDHAPLVLVLAEDESLAQHLAQSLGRKFGIGYLDYLTGLLQPQLARPGIDDPWGGFRLVLVHHRLRLASGYDLIRQVVQKEACPLPVLLVGTEEDLELKRNRAIAAGAVDFLAVEPFHVLAVMRALDSTLQMFG